MNTDEIFENRRAVAIKICQSIRKNGGQLLNAQFFLERPYCADSHSYKFSSTNFLRLLAADNEAICKCNPRWFSADEIKNNSWSIRQHAKPELLEVWTKSSDGKPVCFLQEFYNAWSILDKDSFKPKNQELLTIIENLQARGLIENGTDIISFQDCIDSIKKFAESNGADELTSILTVQTWVAESKLKTKMSLFLPSYSDSILTDIEQAPDKLFESMNTARAILKKLLHEKVTPLAKNLSADDFFRDLKIIYHGSEITLQNEDETVYPN